MIRTALLSDLNQIIKIVEASILDMHSYGNLQWTKDYPKENDFIRDINEETLFVYDINGIIAGLICINKTEPEEYKNADWSNTKQPAIIHRLAVNTEFHGQGIGYKLINYANALCTENGISYIKTDTNSLNIKAQGLLRKSGYRFVDEITFLSHKGIFYCYEKEV
ncbi:MAG: GNAT family N-acetyltransferase [Clostridiaceae bacterium]